MQGLSTYLSTSGERDSPDLDKLEEFFGSLPTTFWTLIGMISGGIDWLVVCWPVHTLGGIYVASLLTYVVFVLFGLMDILTGIFVNVATQAAQLNREIAIDNAMANKTKLTRELVNLFLECDQDQNNKLSLEELQDRFGDE